MIRHIVLFRVHEGTPHERIQDAIDRLKALVGVIPGL
ncbi:Dabb family protein, partial [Arthrobacter sp. B0490]